MTTGHPSRPQPSEAAPPPSSAAPGGAVRRRLRGEVTVDPWGLDPEIADLVRQASTLAIRITVDGPATLPADGPCVVVVNRRFGVVEPFVALRAVHEATGRRARFLGWAPGPLDTLWRRCGGAVDRPEELAGLLRAGEMVLLPLGAERRSRRRAGSLSPERLAPALHLGVPVIPLALVGNELTGQWTAYVGEPVPPPTGSSPLAQFDLAAGARGAVQALLDEAFPPRWLFG
jgi:1-acyl-sn-glycerol-3-phosphate acyltransferase